jgi:predicted NBD/HSP70 family sugar kinase
MDILYKDSFYMDSSFTPEKTVDKIVEIINECYVNLRLESMKFLGIGLGSVGPLDIKNGVIRNPSDFYSNEWKNVPIKCMLEERLRCPITIENGVNAAAVAEYFYGVGKEIENIAFFNCGIGIRTGTISAGNLIRSINDEEEAFSHMIIDINIKQYKCGKSGCIENYASIKSMIKELCKKIKNGRKTTINKSLESINFDDVCSAVEEKDELAIEVVTEAALILGIGLANYIRLLNPKLVILSGPLIIKSELFYDVAIRSALEKLNHTKGKNIIFNRCGYFKKDAISVGAAAMVIERCIDSGI